MKRFKKILSVILAVMMIAAPVTVFAASDHPASDNYPYTLDDMKIVFDEKDENGNYYPLIVVPGISQSKMYVVDENYDYESAEDPTYPPIKKDDWGNELTGSTLIFDIAATAKAAIRYLIIPLICSVILQKDCGLVNAIEKVADVAFSPQQTFTDGSARNETDTVYFDGPFSDYATPEGEEMNFLQDECDYLYRIIPLKPVKETIGDENLFFFEFNLFGNPMDTAAKLDEYIDMVLERTGASKVNLLPISLGGTIFTAFAEKYTNTDKVNAVVCMVAALNGTQVVTDMFNRDFNVDPEYWYTELFPLAVRQYENYLNTVGHAINILFHLLPWDVNAAMISKLYDVMFDHLMVNTPQFWAMIRREAYPELADKFLSGEEHAAVREKTDEFYAAQMNIEKNIKTMKANGIEINLVSGYNLRTGERRYEFMQLMSNSATTNGDGVLNIESTTLGATAVLPGEQLPDDYVQAIDSDYCYISPDREVDASTGALPDNTWYFYDMHHEDAANNAPVINLALALMYSSEVTDVHSNPEKFPQFNGNSDNWYIRRWRYNDLKNLYAQYQAGEVDWPDDAVEECESLLYDCERVMRATIADMAFVSETTKRVNLFLNEYGTFPDDSVNRIVATDEPELSPAMKAVEFSVVTADKIIYKIFGPHGFSEYWKVKVGA